MIVIGLTGGIGAGKSTFAGCLRDLGAAVIDVDAIGRDVIAPGGPGADTVLERFGTLDRNKIAGIVFTDAQARHDLESISWPLIESEINRRLTELARSHDVVVLDMAVLAQGLARGLYGPVITVEANEAVRVQRLIARGMRLEDATARIRAQVPELERIAIADFVVRNEGGADELPSLAAEALASIMGR